MEVRSVSATNVSPSFKAVKFGPGGARRLATTMGVKKAKELIRNNITRETDIVITSDGVKILPPDKSMLLTYENWIVLQSTTPVMGIFNHSEKCMFNCLKPFTNEELLKYGEENKEISIADKIAQEIDENKNDWRSMIKMIPHAVHVSPEIKAAEEEIENYSKTYYTF